MWTLAPRFETMHHGNMSETSTLSDHASGPFHETIQPARRLLPAPPNPSHRFLVIKLSSIGDVVMTTPMARELKSAYPGCQVVAAVEEKSQAIPRMNPYVDEVFVFKVREFQKALRRPTAWPHLRRGLIRAAGRLRSYRFEVAFDAQGRFRSSVLAAMSGAPRRIGFSLRREMNWIGLNETVENLPQRRVGGEDLQLLRPLGVTDPDPTLTLLPSHAAESRADALFRDRGVHPARCALLCPATTQDEKHWTEAGWAEIADRLSERLGLTPVFLGGPGDHALVERIAARMTRPVPSLVGEVSLEEAAAAAQAAALVIAVDTGLAHIGNAVGTPVVVLHGPSPYARLREEPHVRAVHHPDACGESPKGYPCPRCACMAKIAPDDVLGAAESLLTHLTGRTASPSTDSTSLSTRRSSS